MGTDTADAELEAALDAILKGMPLPLPNVPPPPPKIKTSTVKKKPGWLSRLKFAAAVALPLSFFMTNTVVDDRLAASPEQAIAEGVKAQLGNDAYKEMARQPDTLARIKWAHAHAPEVMAEYYTTIEDAIAKSCTLGSIHMCPQHVQRSVISLYRGYAPSKPYEAWDMDNTVRFTNCAYDDKGLHGVGERWGIAEGQPGHMDMNARIAALQRVVDIHAQSYADGAFQPVPAKVVAGEISNPDTDAYYKGKDRTIHFRSTDLTGAVPFEKLARFATHEARHSIQHQLSDALSSPKLSMWLKDRGFSTDATIFSAVAFGKNAGLDLANHAFEGHGYYYNPIEQNARDFEKSGMRAGKGEGTNARCQFLTGM